MSELSQEERSLHEPFWVIETLSEGRLIEAILRRRFPTTYEILKESLEISDPMDIVYPDNPNEYGDVILEILVLLAPVNGVLSELPNEELEKVMREGLARRFGEPPDEPRMREAVQLVRERSSRL